MSENQQSEETQEDEEPREETKLVSDGYEEARRAIEILYIKNNIGARTHLIQKWPDVAHYLFGEELIGYDTEGTDDRDRRSELIGIAEEKRLELVDIAVTLEEKSVIEGVLQAEYVEEVIRKLGRDLSLLLYSARFVDRVFPPPPEPEEDEGESSSEGKESSEAPDSAEPVQQAVPEIETPALSEMPAPLDVQPLDVQPAPPVEPPETPPPSPLDVQPLDVQPAPVEPQEAQEGQSVFKQLLASNKAKESSEEEPPSQ